MWDSLGTWSMVVIIGVTFALEPSCPVCSKFEYEEKLLERVIRNEFALKDTLDKITETHAKVADTLTRIKDDNEKLNNVMGALEAKKHALEERQDTFIQNVSETVQALASRTVKELEVTKQDLRVNVDAFFNSVTKNVSANVAEMKLSVQSLVRQTSKELDILRDGSVVPLVMFHARLQHSGGMFTYAPNQAVVFKTVLVNEGGGYDPDTGNFTASVAGAYMFTVQYCLYPSRLGQFEIVNAGKPVQRSKQASNNEDCSTMQAFAKISIGDNVWVRSTSSSTVNQQDSNYWNSFAGMLIHA